jgi:Coenzyme PQQ synthesis protein D (PqqD)
MTPIYVARSKSVAARMLGGQMMIMSAKDSTLFDLNDTASAIWQAADGKTPLQEIVEREVCANFQVSPEDAMEDAKAFVDELAGHGILVVSDQPISEAEAQAKLRIRAEQQGESAQNGKQGDGSPK